MELTREAPWRWTWVLKDMKEEMRFSPAKWGPENTEQPRVIKATTGRKGSEHTWGVVVQHSVTNTYLQDEGSEQLLHMRQQGV